MAVGPHAAHRARRGRLPDRVRGRGGLRGAATTGSSAFAGAAYAYATLGALELLAAAVFSGDFDGGGRTALYVAFAATVLAVGLAGSPAVRRAQRG